MTIVRARFCSTLGLHAAGNTYLIETPELVKALDAGAIDIETVEIVEPQNPAPTDEERAQIARLLTPPTPAIEEVVPEIPAVEEPVPVAPGGGDA